MGEYADYALDDRMDEWEDAQDYLLGNMSVNEAFERGVIDHTGAMLYATPPFHNSYRSGFRPKNDKTCRCCGEGGLSWIQQGSKWRLGKNGCIHVCPSNPLRE